MLHAHVMPQLQWGLLLLLLMMPGLAQAADRRLALVVGHQHGWAGEQMLPWVLSGDVKPISKLLKHRLGFEVITLKNQDPRSMRRWFRKLKKQIQAKKISTFLFYYSGHADKRYFHLGPRQQRPLSYKEFLGFFLQLPVKRRFAILDACHGGAVIPLAKGNVQRMKKGGRRKPRLSNAILKQINRSLPRKQRFRSLQALRRWHRGAMAKGVRRPRRRINFSRLPVLRREDGTGTHIIGTVGVAWHEPKWRASLLTHQLIRGIMGAADTVKDGRITIEELYNFVQAEARKHGQDLSRFVLFNGNYTFAPNYRSHLRIDEGIVGNVQLRVDQFYWSYQKTKRRGVEIPTIPGKGVVEIKHRGRCWRQSVLLPKGRKIRLRQYGKRINCKRYASLRKGAVLLENEMMTLPQTQPKHAFSLSLGLSELGTQAIRSRGSWFSLGYRWRQWVGASFQYEGGISPREWPLHRLSLQAEGAFPLRLGALTFGFGGFARLGVLMSQGSGSTGAFNTAFSWGAGGLVEVEWMFLRSWGIRLGTQAGLDWTPIAAGSPFSFRWGLQLAVVFAPL